MSDDCISRQAAIDVFKNAIGDKYPFICEPILITLSLLPSVTPKPIITNKSAVFWLENITEKYLKGDTFEDRQMKKSINKAIKALSKEPKTGHWISIDEEPHEVWECDHCGFVIDGIGCIDPYDYRDTYKFCPNCGACMKDGRTLDEFIEDSKESEV